MNQKENQNKFLPRSGSLNYAPAEEIHDYGEFCKYWHVDQAMAKAYPWNKQTNQLYIELGLNLNFSFSYKIELDDFQSFFLFYIG